MDISTYPKKIQGRMAWNLAPGNRSQNRGELSSDIIVKTGESIVPPANLESSNREAND
ncbi:hypothetical protein LEP1GSC061_1877 [Leptospira wolffii serovar Khorat str. Khorat-H2]|nr:hypothetical protein LEP1GSC061_1877 [Leptospira wolffii serovar Khorat str. Khorat-H2]